jgi:hypothetical protein
VISRNPYAIFSLSALGGDPGVIGEVCTFSGLSYSNANVNQTFRGMSCIQQTVKRVDPAYKAARYLNQMIQSGLVHPISSPILDSLYAHTQKEAKNAPRKRRNAKDAKDDVPAENQIILSQDMVLKLQKQLDLPPESAVDIFRGIHQARQRLEDLATNPNNTARSSADSKHSSP